MPRPPYCTSFPMSSMSAHAITTGPLPRMNPPVGAELVIHGSDLRYRWAVVLGHDRRRGPATDVSDLPPARGLARPAGPSSGFEERGDSGAAARGRGAPS